MAQSLRLISPMHANQGGWSMPVLSQIVDEAHDVNTHVEFRDFLQSRKTTAQQVVRRSAMADKPFEIGRC
jgi:hypothetical protein